MVGAGRDVVTNIAIGMVGAGTEAGSVKVNVVISGGLLIHLHEHLGSPGVVNVEIALTVASARHHVVVTILEHEHVRVDPGVPVQRSNAHTWVDANERVLLFPLGSVNRRTLSLASTQVWA